MGNLHSVLIFNTINHYNCSKNREIVICVLKDVVYTNCLVQNKTVHETNYQLHYMIISHHVQRIDKK